MVCGSRVSSLSVECCVCVRVGGGMYVCGGCGGGMYVCGGCVCGGGGYEGVCVVCVCV